MSNELTEVQRMICEECDGIKELLLEKNRKYNNSALEPIRVFSKAANVEQIKVRLDDKLKRIQNSNSDEDEDVVKDLIGYLVLLRIAKRVQAQASKPQAVAIEKLPAIKTQKEIDLEKAVEEFRTAQQAAAELDKLENEIDAARGNVYGVDDLVAEQQLVESETVLTIY